jgi:hypothetical protein
VNFRVAFDLDGTLADMQSVLHREAEALFGAKAARRVAPVDGSIGDPPLAAAVDALPLTSRQMQRLWRHVERTEDFWTTLPETEEGIVRRIAETAEARRWDVLFITTRPTTNGDTTQRQSQRWLDLHGFPFPSVYIVQRSRGKLADALQLDAVVDDRVENCMDVAMDSKAAPVLVWPGGDLQPAPSVALSLGVRAVSSPSEALALLERLDRDRSPGVVGSVRRMLGGKRSR